MSRRKIDVQFPYNKVDFVHEWILYKGEKVFAGVNHEKSLACHRVIIDIAYCATKYFNNIYLKTVNYKPEQFQRLPLDQR